MSSTPRNLVATSFSTAEYGDFSDQQCDGGLFYTCSATSPPFWGCCQSNPCTSGACPANDLSPAFLSGNPLLAAPFLALNGSVSASTTSSAGASSASSTSTSSPSTLSTLTTSGSASTSTSPAASPSTTEAATSQSSSNTGAIAGGAVSGGAVLVALILGLVWLLRRRRKGTDSKRESTEARHTTEIQQTNHGLGLTGASVAKEEYKDHPATSPTIPSYPGSPQPPYSPGPPSYVDERAARNFSYELPGSPGGQEMDSGQRYHAYRQ
ncbi:hypothetical protein Slin15195_G037080 [Septoria linicola]|uniref:Uncharacterized protein n=1 Tax=Septoria linicola TaxID=215465 RepID=A0A9Q9AJA8_9PEZI|nr:hypothetical protein Slin15195_G037080 [Septoria linicola]